MVNFAVGLFLGMAVGTIIMALLTSGKVEDKEAEIDVLLLRCKRHEEEYEQLVRDTSVKV